MSNEQILIAQRNKKKADQLKKTKELFRFDAKNNVEPVDIYAELIEIDDEQITVAELMGRYHVTQGINKEVIQALSERLDNEGVQNNGHYISVLEGLNEAVVLNPKLDYNAINLKNEYVRDPYEMKSGQWHMLKNELPSDIKNECYQIIDNEYVLDEKQRNKIIGGIL